MTVLQFKTTIHDPSTYSSGVLEGAVDMRSDCPFGAAMTAYPGTGRTHRQEVDAHIAEVGMPRVIRTFDGGQPLTWASKTSSGSINPSEYPEFETIMHSMKPVMTGTGDEFLDWAGAYFATIPQTAQRKMFTIWHEPENDVNKPGKFSSAQWVRKMRLFARAVRATRRDDLLVGPIFMSRWTLRGQPNYVYEILQSDPAAYEELFALVDFIGWDPYHMASLSGDYGKDMATYYLDPVVDFSETYFPRVPIAIGETGLIPYKNDPQIRVKFLNDVADYAQRHYFTACCYFDATGDPDSGNPWYLRRFTDGTPDTASAVAWGEVYKR